MGQMTRRNNWKRWVPVGLMALGALVALKWALALVLSPLFLLGAAGVGAWLLFRDDRKALPAQTVIEPGASVARTDLDEFDRRLREAEQSATSDAAKGRRS
jgi:hypothetical protein